MPTDAAAPAPGFTAGAALTDGQAADLAARAAQARALAYAPYSNYAVGAALLSASGAIFIGVNVENAAYPATICAERAAVVRAVSDGEREFVAIAVATANGGHPCGTCRQVLAEFGVDTVVLIAGADGQVLSRTSVHQLLPESFGPGSLE